MQILRTVKLSIENDNWQEAYGIAKLKSHLFHAFGGTDGFLWQKGFKNDQIELSTASCIVLL